MTNNYSECPECGSEGLKRKGSQIVGITEWANENGSVDDHNLGNWDCFIDEVQCECLNCGHEWTVDTKTTVVSGCVYLPRIIYPGVSSRNGLSVCKTEARAVQMVADYCREEWRGDDPLPPEDDWETINAFFQSRGDAEDYDILQLPIKE